MSSTHLPEPRAAKTFQEPSLRKDAPFPFFQLPILVQWKVLRQYVSFGEKITRLCLIKEFAKLLESEIFCWLRVDTVFLSLLPLISQVSPGLYVLSHEELPHHGYYVSMGGEEERITFTFCMLIPTQPRFRKNYFSLQMKNEPLFVKTLTDSDQKVKRFLKFFSQRYVLANRKQYQAYFNDTEKYSERFTFIINQSTQKVVSDYGNVSVVNRNKSCYFNRSTSLFCISSDSVVVKHHEKKEQVLSKPLESLVYDPKENTVYQCRVMCRFKFELFNNTTIYEHYPYCYWFCSHYKDLFKT